MAGTICTRTNGELLDELRTLPFLPEGFFKPDTSFNGVLLDNAYLANAIQMCVGHMTFQEAFDRTFWFTFFRSFYDVPLVFPRTSARNSQMARFFLPSWWTLSHFLLLLLLLLLLPNHAGIFCG